MFRHACGFQLANQGTNTRTLQAYLGHRNIHTRCQSLPSLFTIDPRRLAVS
jgi:hypothetical protein